ncbi:hypothetical protein [Streptomyces lancefieldiae]|uniref:Uncharacterized protein n=1 Tax=Streptomyces lancefieldiae TaxID=3075520 RepID=A0ABU3AN06_9ACTN|nr:hypothetical protein [Streptomyces sp. DSM 40712]MDT0611250.1 hypothetical protein [Streptomyces sp. DSM 40712]
MSTEARRAPVPPRPDTPPRPEAPPHPDASSRPGVLSGADASSRPDGADPAAPPPLPSARFPDAPPAVGRGASGENEAPQAHHPTAPPTRRAGIPEQPPRGNSAPRHRPGAPTETPEETTTRLRPIPAQPAPEPAPTSPPRAAPTPMDASASAAASAPAPDPALSWSAPPPSADRRPRVSFGQPEGYDEPARPRPLGGSRRPQAVAAAVCLVLGLGLVTGAVTGSWLAGDAGDGDARSAFTTAGDLWHSVPVDQLFPPVVQGQGAGPGGADRAWTRVAVAPDSDCVGAFDPLLAKVLDPVGCRRLLRATYTDATQSHVTTVGLLFAKADAAAMTSLAGRFEKEDLGRRDDLMPLPYAAKDTVAAGFGARQRASWTVSVLTDAPVVVYAVSGWADGRTVDEPEPAEEAMESGATSAPAQAGLGHEAQGLADRVERALRKNVGSATEHPS